MVGVDELPPGTPLTKEQFVERMSARLEAAKAKKAAPKRHPWKGPSGHKTLERKELSMKASSKPAKRRNSGVFGAPGHMVQRSDGKVFKSFQLAADAVGYASYKAIMDRASNGKPDKLGYTYVEIKEG